MIIRLSTLVVVLVNVILFSYTALASESTLQCISTSSSNEDRFIQEQCLNQLSVTITSDMATVIYSNNAIFNGHVDVYHGNRHLKSDYVYLSRKLFRGTTTFIDTIDLLGDVQYDDDHIALSGPQAWINLHTKDVNMWDGTYTVVGRQERGFARKIELRKNNRYTILKHGTFTSCPLGKRGWIVEGSKIIHDRDSELSEIWNARFKIGSIPIFYSPYLQIPKGNKARSGFLVPRGSYNKFGGLQFLFPYYWNITPQADATVMARYISRRGIQWQNEFRYLMIGSGLLEFDYLKHDRIYTCGHDQHGSSSPRWLLHWHHSNFFTDSWRFQAEYTKVSDSDYFRDLDSEYGSITNGYLAQKFDWSYVGRNWDITLSRKYFQILSTKHYHDFYSAEPQIDFNYYSRNLRLFDSHLYSQVVRFTNRNPYMPEAMRLHIEPMIYWPYITEWNRLNTTIKVLATHYLQNNIEYYNLENKNINKLKNSVNRIIPQFSIDEQMRFDHDMILLPGYTQSLEPRIQYLYIPYHDQRSIHSYDSTLLLRNYYSLFQERKYSGLDRIESANQLTTGLTMRIFDGHLHECFNISIGQIYSFVSESRRVNHEPDRHSGVVSLVACGKVRMQDHLVLSGGVYYDTYLDRISQGDCILEWRSNVNHMIQISYRYISENYITQVLLESDIDQSRYKQDISQVGITASWSIVDQWSIAGSCYYNTKTHLIVDQLVGIQYSSCCYSVKLGYAHNIKDWVQGTSKYDNKLIFNIELRGLSSNNCRLDTTQMFHQGILPYQSAI
ncbi:LPS-assembly protein LptD [Candidatus Erwinia haradaeae]|uniref:LPS-assembly protein LptD n=1 Tax=Candidatus Erwinia haradaeae TaxID=1922217 RepID=A0A451D8Z3_9GAMM|nr:LPS-assembly protein LptD [Candidatus Erwinia haradaeae]